MPIVGKVPTDELLTFDNNIRYVNIRKEYLEGRGLNSIKIVIANDDSLAGDGILQGYEIIHDLSDRTVIDGKLYLVRIGNKTFGCKIFKKPNNTLDLHIDHRVENFPTKDVFVISRIIGHGYYKAD